MTNWNELTTRCHEAMKLAAKKPGRYGGRYVGRRYLKVEKRDEFVVLADDDPSTVPKDVDVLAQVTPYTVYPIGRARFYLLADGTVSFPD